MILDELTQERFEAAVAKMGPETLVPKVDHVRPTAARPFHSDEVVPFMAGFSLHWEEFQRMAATDLWGRFLAGVIEDQILKVKAMARDEETRVKFFRFNHPPTSHNVRSFAYDADGVFAVLTARHCVHQTHKDKGTEVVEFIFRMEVGKFDK